LIREIASEEISASFCMREKKTITTIITTIIRRIATIRTVRARPRRPRLRPCLLLLLL
jgi:hypothetical protein